MEMYIPEVRQHLRLFNLHNVWFPKPVKQCVVRILLNYRDISLRFLFNVFMKKHNNVKPETGIISFFSLLLKMLLEEKYIFETVVFNDKKYKLFFW